MNETLQTALGTGPFFGRKTPLAKPRCLPRRGQSHFHGGRPGILSQRRWRRENSDSPRSGLTLIELLVVLGIMLTLVVIAAPALRPAIEGRRAREAARGLSVFLGSARSRAMETGRPAGVIFERFTAVGTARSQASIVVRPAEVPPLYGGDTTDTAIKLQTSSTATSSMGMIWTVSATTVSGSLAAFFSRGDMFQVNYQGPWYAITATSGGSSMVSAMTATTTGGVVPWPWDTTGNYSAALPVQIRRQPQSAAGPAFQMPFGAVVDLGYSGSDDGTNLIDVFDAMGSEPPASASMPICLVFSPNGSVAGLYYYDTSGLLASVNYPTNTIYLLIGRMDRIPTSRSVTTTPNPDTKNNLEDPANFWVAINPRTGLITTAEMYYDSSMTTTTTGARKYARQFLTAGGR